MKWGSEQHLLPPFRDENDEKLERAPCAGRLDFVHRRSTSEHLAPPEVALAARRGSGGLRASKLVKFNKS